jgi:hypothetical protein
MSQVNEIAKEKVNAQPNNDVNNDIIVSDALIRKMAATQCDMSRHTQCYAVTDEINKHINAGVIFNDIFLKAYIQFLTRDSHYYYSRTQQCITYAYHKKVFEKLLQYIPVTDECYVLLAKKNTKYIIEILLDLKYQLSDVLFSTALINKNAELVTYLIDKNVFTYTTEHLYQAQMALLNTVVNALLNSKVIPDEKCLNLAITQKNEENAKLMFALGAKLNDQVLIIACTSLNMPIVKLALENKIKPTAECFNAIIKGTKVNPYYGNRYNRYNAPNKQLESDIIELLIQFGYQVTYDNVVEATRNFIKINDIDRFDIKLDEKFLEVCAEVHYYPYKLDIAPTTKCLEKECTKSGNITIIKEIISKGVKPDSACLEQACKHKANLATIKYLVEHGAKMNVDCLKAIATTVGGSVLQYVVTEFCKTIPAVKIEETKVAKNKVEDDEELDVDDTNIDEEIIDEADDETEDLLEEEQEEEEEVEEVEEIKPVSIRKSKKIKSKKKQSDDLNLDLDSDMEGVELELDANDKKNKKTSRSKSKVIIIKDKKKQPAKDNTEDNNIEDNKPTVYECVTFSPVKVTIEIKKKLPLNDKIQKMLKLKKTDQMTFLEIRKKFMEYFNKNKLYDEKDKMYIKIDKHIADTLNLKENKYINVNDIDNFIQNQMV